MACTFLAMQTETPPLLPSAWDQSNGMMYSQAGHDECIDYLPKPAITHTVAHKMPIISEMVLSFLDARSAVRTLTLCLRMT